MNQHVTDPLLKRSKDAFWDLGPAAREHVKRGGCSGDFCPSCSGVGSITEPHPTEHDRHITGRCYRCNGSGMGK